MPGWSKDTHADHRAAIFICQTGRTIFRPVQEDPHRNYGSGILIALDNLAARLKREKESSSLCSACIAHKHLRTQAGSTVFYLGRCRQENYRHESGQCRYQGRTLQERRQVQKEQGTIQGMSYIFKYSSCAKVRVLLEAHFSLFNGMSCGPCFPVPDQPKETGECKHN